MRVVVLGVDSYLGSRFAEWIGRIPHTEAVGWAMCKSSDTGCCFYFIVYRKLQTMMVSLSTESTKLNILFMEQTL